MDSQPADRSSRAGVLAAFAALYLIWGTTYLSIALAIQTIPPFIAGAARYLIAALLMYAWLRWRSREPLAGVPMIAALICGVLLSGIGNGFVIWAQQGIPSGVAALIVAATPVAIGLLDWAFFSRRPPGLRAMTGIAVGLAGVVIIVLHTQTLSGAAQPMHLVAMIVAVTAWSIGTLLQQQKAHRATVMSFTCVQMFSGGVFQLIVSATEREWSGFDIQTVSLTSALAVLYLIVFGSLIALTAFLWLLTRVSAQKVTTYTLVNPVVALILGALILDERITLVSIIAATLVIVGVALVLFQNVSLISLLRRRSQPSSVMERRT